MNIYLRMALLALKRRGPAVAGYLKNTGTFKKLLNNPKLLEQLLSGDVSALKIITQDLRSASSSFGGYLGSLGQSFENRANFYTGRRMADRLLPDYGPDAGKFNVHSLLGAPYRDEMLMGFLYPRSATSAFLGGAVRGGARSGVSHMTNYWVGLAARSPATLSRFPQAQVFMDETWKTFVKGSGQGFRKSVGLGRDMKLTDPGTIWSGLKSARTESLKYSRAARAADYRIALQPDNLWNRAAIQAEYARYFRYEKAGYVTSRVGIFSMLNLRTEEQRKETTKTNLDYAGKMYGYIPTRSAHVWVSGHTRKGYHVKGHYRKVTR